MAGKNENIGAPYPQIMKDLKAGIYAPVYLLEGDEPYYIDAVAEYIENNVLDEMAREFDLTILYGKDISNIDTVINAAKRFPMMGSKSVIIVREAQNISSWGDMEHYMEKPQPTTILVFCYKNGKLNANTKAFKSIRDGGVVLVSEKLKDFQVPQWIAGYVKEKGLDIEQKAIQMLAEYLGSDLSRIIHELDKLLLGRPQGVSKITADLVQRNVGISKDYNTFELQNAIVSYDIVKVNRIVCYFAENQKKHPIQLVIPAIYKFFSSLLLYHYLPDKSLSPKEIGDMIGVNQYAVRDLVSATRYYSALQTMKILGWLREADARSKGMGDSNSDPLHLYQELIYKMMHRI